MLVIVKHYVSNLINFIRLTVHLTILTSNFTYNNFIIKNIVKHYVSQF